MYTVNIIRYGLPVLARNLLLTILIELCAAALIGIKLKEGKNWQRIIQINVMTNIPASLLVLLYSRLIMPQYVSLRRSVGITIYAVLQLILEIIIVFVEAKLLDRWLTGWPKKAILASVALNVSSYLTGVIIGVYWR